MRHSLTPLYAIPIFIVLLSCSGPEGIEGPAGPTGLPGKQGPAGMKGSDGIEGPKGSQGEKGDTGSQGPIGPKGDHGADGPIGESGADGERGSTGAQGIPGPKGDTGERGLKGNVGSRGTTGFQGIPGPEGPQGPQGDQGEQGDQGKTGPEGAQGTRGPVGPQGPQGATGATGSTGATGPTGQPEVIMISALLEFDNLGVINSTTTPCAETHTLYNLEDVGSNGATYSADQSWLGIKSAALCTGNTSSFVWTALQLAEAKSRTQKGLGLVVEIDLSRLPNNSIDTCSFSLSGKNPPEVSSIFGPPRHEIHKTISSGNSEYLSIAKIGSDLVVDYPEVDMDYYLQGVCVK